MIRDSQGHTLLGGRKMVKSLFGKRAIGSEKYAKSELEVMDSYDETITEQFGRCWHWFKSWLLKGK